MDYFTYRAVDSIGSNFTGTVQAIHISEARKKLMEGGFIVLELDKVSPIKKALESLRNKKISTKYISVFCRQLHIILRSGVTVLRGLTVIKEQADNKKHQEFMEKLYTEVQKGRSLSEALQDCDFQIPYLLINMVALGEESGNLEEILQRMAIYYEKEEYLKSKVLGAMIYPGVMAFVSVVLVIFFLNFVMPEIMGVFTQTEAQLPQLTTLVIEFTDFFKKYFHLMLLGVVAIIALIKVFLPLEVKRRIKSVIFTKMPMLKNAIKDVITTRFLRNFGLLLRAGVPIIPALNSILKIMDNPVLEKLINQAMEGIKRGEKLGDNFKGDNYFDPVVIHMINIGQETGQLDEIMDLVAEHYERQSEVRLMKLTSAMEPLMIVVLGMVMGVLVVAMVMPMFDMLGNLKK
jgi:type IV pilus assembly protein PilC